MKLIRFLFAFILLTAISSCSYFQDEPQGKETNKALKRIIPAEKIYVDLDKKRIQLQQKRLDSVFSKLQKLTGFNGTVLFAEKGRVVYKKAYGYADIRRNREPLTVDSRFELASVSKMFTAMAIMILHERGKIDYNTDIRKYIPQWPYEGVTVRNLLNHRSGMPRYESLADEKWPDKHVPLTNDAMIRLFVQYQPAPYFKPDNGFHYCNTNYALLGSIVEKVSGQPFCSFMKENIFDPLDMHNSLILGTDSATLHADYVDVGVPGYDHRRRGFIQVKNDYLNGVKGDKSMYSTVGDLYQFDKALYYELLVSKETLKEAFSPGSPRHKRRNDNYGFGWRIRGDADSAVYHYGWWKGFRSFFLRDMKQHKTLIVLTNKDKGPGSDHFWNIINDSSLSLFPASVNIRYEKDNGMW
ncbi:MAG: beta-lactamase family protein [Bacteroidales bacterium]|nr:beta-lactamase family protein [Bacteroidales bacterium]